MKTLAVVVIATVALVSLITAADARVVEFDDGAALASTPAVIDSVPAQADDLVAWAPGALLVR